jgi:hypothetical protein
MDDDLCCCSISPTFLIEANWNISIPFSLWVYEKNAIREIKIDI